MPHGVGTLMTVLTIVTEAFSASARPLSVVQHGLPAVENVVAADEMMVPTIVPPPAPLMVAALPTCQKTFFGWAPPARITLRGAPAAPTVRSEEHTSELQSHVNLVCRLLLEKKKKKYETHKKDNC